MLPKYEIKQEHDREVSSLLKRTLVVSVYGVMETVHAAQGESVPESVFQFPTSLTPEMKE